MLSLVVVALLALGIGSGGVSAFNRGGLSARTSNAAVVADSASYLGISQSTCNVTKPLGGTCKVTFYDESVKAMNVAATETSDPSTIASPNSLASTALSPGGSVLMTITIGICPGACLTTTYPITYSVTGDTTNVINVVKTFTLTVHYV